jgi:hypothetical protein
MLGPQGPKVQFPSNVEPGESNTQTLEPLELELDEVLELELDAVLELDDVLEVDDVLELDSDDEPPLPAVPGVLPQPAAHGSAASTTIHAWRKPLVIDVLRFRTHRASSSSCALLAPGAPKQSTGQAQRARNRV